MMARPNEQEGVIKYTFQHVAAPIAAPPQLDDILEWRSRLRAQNLIGADAQGVGYGNLSVRLHASPRFFITGSQSSGLLQVDRRHFAAVTVVDLDRNFLKSTGETPPSSEALTHAALYQVDNAIRAVVHVHSAELWEANLNRLPTTKPEVAYGTPEMAYEMIRLHKRSAIGKKGCVVMAGHRDGVIAFGASLADAAGEILALRDRRGAGL
jgi:ribulose-5-phosphate 4-epimerase/fuculose-1-phosphate aldolase